MSPSDGLLERSDQLAMLDESLAAVAPGSGREARARRRRGWRRQDDPGEGVLRPPPRGRARSSGAHARACSPLGPLGPFLDVAEQTGGELEERVRTEARPYDIAAALIRELAGARPDRVRSRGSPLGRRSDARRRSSCGTQGRGRAEPRPRDLSQRRARSHASAHPPARRADLDARRRPDRSPAAFAEQAVRELAEPHDVDAADLYRRTSGNPFFVTEVLAAGTSEMPPTVRDAVLARVARLSASGSRLCSTPSRSRPRRPTSGCSRSWPPPSWPTSRSAWRPAWSPRRRTASRSGTSWPARPSRRRCRRTAGSTSTARAVRPSRGAAGAASRPARPPRRSGRR